VNLTVWIKDMGLALARWFDSYAGGQEDLHEAELAVDWVRCIPFLTMHLICLSVIWVGWSWVAVGTAIALYLVRMLAITGFYHRYFSHRTFKTSRAVQFVFAVIGNSSVQRSPLWWAAHHRYHHSHADNEDDIHSPRRHGFFWSHVGWFTSKPNFKTRKELIPDLMKFPELVFLDRFDTVVPILLAVTLYLSGIFMEKAHPSWGTSGTQMLIWGFFISTVFLFHGTFTINSLAHQIGRRRYPTRDDSKNSLFLSLVTLGEGWHNNHHFYPGSASQAHYWWEIDITYCFLLLLNRMKLIWDLNPVPEEVLKAAVPHPAPAV